MKKAQHSRKHKPFVDKPLCSYLHRYCTQPRLDGYKFCIRHILEDKNAPFRQCSYVQQENHKRCTNAAPKNDKRDGLCPWHLKQTQLPKAPPAKTIEQDSASDLLLQLEQYCKDSAHNPSYDPDKHLSERYDALPALAGISDLPYLGSGTKDHKTHLDQAWLHHSDESESDLDEKDFDDPLRYAGIYTYEEVARIYRDKLVHLQSLYIDQFKWLQYKLQEKRRNYVQALRIEKKSLGSVHNTPRKTEEDEKAYLKLKHMFRYHRRYGTEALLYAKSLQKRRDTVLKTKQPNIQYCIFSADKEKCTARALPLSKFCLNHILSDPQQVLFKRCTDCSRPVIPFNDNKNCDLHSRCGISSTKRSGTKKLTVSAPVTATTTTATATIVSDIMNPDQEHFQSMDDIASLGLDAVGPGSLFGLNQFGEPGESTDSLSDDHGGLMRIQPISLSASDILCDTRKSSESDSVK